MVESLKSWRQKPLKSHKTGGCLVISELELSGASRPFGYEPGSIKRDLTTVWPRQNKELAFGLGLGLYRIVRYIYKERERERCINICSESRAHSTGPSRWLVFGQMFARARKI